MSVGNINSIAEELGINLSANEDSVFHEKCREIFVNRAKFIQPYKKRRIEEKNTYIRVPTLRSQEPAFDLETQCILCGYSVIDKEKVTEFYRVSTKNCQESFSDKCNERQDSWGEKVRDRINIAVDLPAKDALYHKECNAHFRCNRQIPLKFLKFPNGNEQSRVV